MSGGRESGGVCDSLENSEFGGIFLESKVKSPKVESQEGKLFREVLFGHFPDIFDFEGFFHQTVVGMTAEFIV